MCRAGGGRQHRPGRSAGRGSLSLRRGDRSFRRGGGRQPAHHPDCRWCRPGSVGAGQRQRHLAHPAVSGHPVRPAAGGGVALAGPQPVTPWTTTLQATKAPSPCPQILPVVNIETGSENCLYLNVFVPAAVPTTPRPVMVWIYGGGFTEGGSTDDSPANFAADNDTITVSFNYRLGPLGFLALPSLAKASPDHATGDEGLQDQQAALRWVQQNIAAFGGNPHNVTLFGESAGGISVCAQLLSPGAAGLFQKGITESGPCTLPSLPLSQAESEGAELAAKLGCPTGGSAAQSTAQLTCMRSKSDAQVIEAMPPDPALLFGHGAVWDPVDDGVTLPHNAAARLASGDYPHIPMIVGANRDEGRLFVALEYNAAGRTLTAAQWAPAVDKYFGPVLGPKVQREYPLADYPDAGAAFGQALGDAVLACPAVESAAALSNTRRFTSTSSSRRPTSSCCRHRGSTWGRSTRPSCRSSSTVKWSRVGRWCSRRPSSGWRPPSGMPGPVRGDRQPVRWRAVVAEVVRIGVGVWVG